MIYENIDKLIANAMHNHDVDRLSTLRLIKTKFLEYKTSKGAKPIDENIEFSILKKMVDQRTESIMIYNDNNRADLAEKELKELTIIKEFLPKEVTIEEVEKSFNNVLNEGIEPIKKNMGIFIKKIKEELPFADGKMVSSFVGQKLN